jgi:hypothetical protein
MSCSRLFATLAAAFFAAGAGAEVITFDELAHGDPYRFVNPLTSGGFLFHAGCNDGLCLAVWGRDSPHQADPGNAAVFTNVPNVPVTMSQVGDGAFDLHAIDLGDVYDEGSSMTVRFDFHYKSGPSDSETITLDKLKGLQTVVLDRRNLDHVAWTTLTGDDGTLGTQFDNVDIAAVQPVPEPATAASMLAGLIALGVWASRGGFSQAPSRRFAKVSIPGRRRR